MKFFGYTKKIPRLADIKKEIGLMDALTKQGTIGITYLIGTFDDSPEGYSKNRQANHKSNSTNKAISFRTC